MGDIVIKVPSGFAGSITIQFDSTAEATVDASPSKPWPAQVEEILTRFAEHDSANDHLAMSEFLVELGFEPYPPQKKGGAGPSDKPYIRWVYDGDARTVRLYQNSAGLESDSKPQFDFAKGLDGAVPEGGKHPKVRFHYAKSSAETVRAAAKSFTSFADVEA